MVGKACLPSNAYYPRTPDYSLRSGVHVSWSEHSDSSFVYGFMSLDYGFDTMTGVSVYLALPPPHLGSLPPRRGKIPRGILPKIPRGILPPALGILPPTPEKGKRKVQGVPQSQTAALPSSQKEEKTDKSKQAQIEQTYEKH